jgi:hypothetical protein
MNPAHRHTSRMTSRTVSRLRALLDDSNTGVLLGAIILTAAAVMFGAIFSPFITDGCINCPSDYTFPARSVFQGLDGWIVLLVMAALLLSAAYLRKRRQRGFAIACVVLAAAAVALCIFERVDAARRVIAPGGGSPPVELGHPGASVEGFLPPVYTDFGFYLLLISSIVALLAAIAVLVTTPRNRRPDRTGVKQPATHVQPSSLSRNIRIQRRSGRAM